MNENIIEIKDLTMSYGANQVLKGVDMRIRKGEIIGYIGPNGAGKSTTVKILLGLIDDYEGSVKIKGEDIKGKTAYKKNIGYVPESGDVYSDLTGREYLRFLGQIYGMKKEDVDEKSKELLKFLGVDQACDNRISSYSKGMRQKLLIVASLIHNPEILFLDEPLSGLDANSVSVFKEILGNLSKSGTTIFYSSHIMEVVEKISDRIILINQGKIQADGSFDEIKKKNKDGSLEEIFNQLTGFDEHQSIADKFVGAMKEVK